MDKHSDRDVEPARESETNREPSPMRPVSSLDMRPVHPGLRGPMTQARRDRMRLRLAAWAFTTRRVPQGAACSILRPKGKPHAGDLVLARVDVIGQHGNLHMVNGRRRHLFVGDEIVVAYGNRYASNQFEALVPETMGPCHLVAGGGMASRAVSWHVAISRGPTEITPLGLLANADGGRINLRDFALEPATPQKQYRPTPVAVIGTSMDSGKTQTAVHLVRGLIAAGLRVGYAKVTGTGAGGDYWWLKDAGADPVLDFTDVGMVSTYRVSPEEVERALVSLVSHVASHGTDAMVLEIADGVLQQETAALLNSPKFSRLVGGIVLAAQDSMGALAGVDWLRGRPTPLLALSGVLTAAPLQIAEAREATGLAIYDREGLASPNVAMELLGRAQHHLDSQSTSRAGVA